MTSYHYIWKKESIHEVNVADSSLSEYRRIRLCMKGSKSTLTLLFMYSFQWSV